MDGFELNKMAGAVLLAGIVTMVVGFFGNALVPSEHPAANVIVAKGGGGGGAPKAAPVAEKPVDIAPLMASANVDKGKEEARKCAACHNFAEGAGAKIGPDLWNVVGRKIASAQGFSYSKALESVGGEWTYQKLSEWLTNPQGFARGTKMSFAGIRKPDDRADVIAYLRTLSENPKPLPEVHVDQAQQPAGVTPPKGEPAHEAPPAAQKAPTQQGGAPVQAEPAKGAAPKTDTPAAAPAPAAAPPAAPKAEEAKPAAPKAEDAKPADQKPSQ